MTHSVLLALAGSLLLAGCSRNNLLLGEVRANVAGHPTTVTDCFQVQVPAPNDAAGAHTWFPCRDSHITLQDEHLEVNGRPYGVISSGASIVVDHGQVLVNGRELQPLQQ